MATKTLKDVQEDMSQLYNSLQKGGTELKLASELANIAGKYLKAEQLILAREVFESQRKPAAPALPATENGDGGIPRVPFSPPLLGSSSK